MTKFRLRTGRTPYPSPLSAWSQANAVISPVRLSNIGGSFFRLHGLSVPHRAVASVLAEHPLVLGSIYPFCCGKRSCRPPRLCAGHHNRIDAFLSTTKNTDRQRNRNVSKSIVATAPNTLFFSVLIKCLLCEGNMRVPEPEKPASPQ